MNRKPVILILMILIAPSALPQDRRKPGPPRGQSQRYTIEQACSDRAQMSWLYASRFAEVRRSLSAAQMQELMKLRDLEGYPCSGAYLYSQRIPEPDYPDTDFLFLSKSQSLGK